MPIDISQKLLSARYGGDESKKDIHEKNIGFLRMCRKAALFTAEKQGWDIVECGCGDEPLSIDTIFEKLTEIIQ